MIFFVWILESIKFFYSKIRKDMKSGGTQNVVFIDVFEYLLLMITSCILLGKMNWLFVENLSYLVAKEVYNLEVLFCYTKWQKERC